MMQQLKSSLWAVWGKDCIHIVLTEHYWRSFLENSTIYVTKHAIHILKNDYAFLCLWELCSRDQGASTHDILKHYQMQDLIQYFSQECQDQLLHVLS